MVHIRQVDNSIVLNVSQEHTLHMSIAKNVKTVCNSLIMVKWNVFNAKIIHIQIFSVLNIVKNVMKGKQIMKIKQNV